MSAAARHTLSFSVRVSAMTCFFQVGLWYHWMVFLSARRMSGFLSPSTSAMARP